MSVLSTISLVLSFLVLPAPDSVWVSPQRDTVVAKKQIQKMHTELDHIKRELEEIKKSSTHSRYKQLEKRLADSSNVITSLRSQISSLEQENAELLSQIKELGDIKVVWLDNMVADANQWLSSSFDNLNTATLNEALPNYEKNRNESEDLNDAYNALIALKANSDLYSEARLMLSTRYDAENVKYLFEEGTKAKESDINVMRQAEWTTVLELLSNYGDYYEVMKDLVTNIEDAIKDASSTRWRGIQDSILQRENDRYDTELYINSIPWLSEQWNKYKTAVSEGSENRKNEAKKEIDGISAHQNTYKPSTR